MEASAIPLPHPAELSEGPLYDSPLWQHPDVAQPAQPFIEKYGRFTSDRDKHIARSLSDALDRSLVEGRLAPSGYTAANTSLRALVPVTGPTGKRQIDGKTLPPTVESLIASRLASQEIDIASPEGSWGRLPEIVKNELVLHGADMKLELAANCTVGCSFCALADKGPISAKTSFDSAVGVMGDIMQRQDTYGHHPLGSFDSAYWGTDPFDLKWAANGSIPERDYTDLQTAYNALGAPRSRYLCTTTAVPIGEEMRVLNFGYRELCGQNPNYAPLRISRTHANASRVGHILTILKALRPDNKLKINDVSSHTAIRGAKWAMGGQVSLWDITGPNCRDGAIIGVYGVDGVVMQGASPERPSGELRQPIEQPHAAGMRYVIPQHQVKPILNGRVRLKAIYPDVIRTIIDCGGPTPARHEERMAGDPHRALLRVAGALINFSQAADFVPIEIRHTLFNRTFGRDVAVIEEHVAAGNENRSMRGLLGLLADKGYITTQADTAT